MAMKLLEAFVSLTARDQGATAAIGKVKAAGKALHGQMQGLAGLLVGGLGFAAVGKAAHFAFSEFAGAERAAMLLRSQLKATGGAAGVTAEQIEDMASAMQKSTRFEADAVSSAAAQLLRFRNISGDVFEETIKLAGDMAVVMGGDLGSAMNEVGAMVNNPLRGLQLLQRQGASFTDQQKEQIKVLVESGKTMEAQKMILGELSKMYGGAAKNELQTYVGLWEQLKNQVADFGENVGKLGAGPGGGDGFLKKWMKGIVGGLDTINKGDQISVGGMTFGSNTPADHFTQPWDALVAANEKFNAATKKGDLRGAQAAFQDALKVDQSDKDVSIEKQRVTANMYDILNSPEAKSLERNLASLDRSREMERYENAKFRNTRTHESLRGIGLDNQDQGRLLAAAVGGDMNTVLGLLTREERLEQQKRERVEAEKRRVDLEEQAEKDRKTRRELRGLGLDTSAAAGLGLALGGQEAFGQFIAGMSDKREESRPTASFVGLTEMSRNIQLSALNDKKADKAADRMKRKLRDKSQPIYVQLTNTVPAVVS